MARKEIDMQGFSRRTTLREALPNTRGVVPLFGGRGVVTLGDLSSLTLADWWRSARASFLTLAYAASRARVAPSDGVDITLLWKENAAHDLTDGLKATKNPKLSAIANALDAAGVTSVMLVLRLRVVDLKSIEGIGDVEVSLLKIWLDTHSDGATG